MKHTFKRIMAALLVLIMVFTPSAVGMMQVHGAVEGPAEPSAATEFGPKPIAAYDLTSGLSNSEDATGRSDLADIILDPESDARTDADRLASTSHSGRASYNGGIEMWNGFFSLPDNVFSGIDKSQVDGMTVSFKLYNITGWWVGTDWYADWARILFSFSSEDIYADKDSTAEISDPSKRVAASFFMTRNGNVGTAPYQYGNTGSNKYEKNWMDGSLSGNVFPYESEHTITVTYDVATNTAVLYVDGIVVRSSSDSPWKVGASLTVDQIYSFTSFMFGRPNAGNFGNWGFANYKDVTIYSTALTDFQVYNLTNAPTIQAGWWAVEHYGDESADGHTVTFVYDDGVTPPRTQKVADGTEIELPALTDREKDDGFLSIWDGWLCDVDGEIYGGYASYTVTEDVTFTAQWIDEICYATFDANGGMCANGLARYREELESGMELEMPGAAKRDGYAFTGWLCSRDRKVYQPGDTYVVMRDVTFTAQWEILYKVTFVDEDGETVGKVLKRYGETLKESDYPKVPVKAGYRVEWPVVTEPITKDMIVQAIYTLLPPADIDGDGELTNADALALFLHIFDPVENPLDLEVADINHDGMISNEDALLIFLYLFDPIANPIV